MKGSKIAVIGMLTLLAFGLMVIAAAQTPQASPATKQEVKKPAKVEQRETKQPEKKEVMGKKKMAMPEKDIFMAAMAQPDLKTFVSALQTAGLTEMLKGKGPYTVFAPSDSAFARMPKDQLDALIKDKPRLEAVLKYHIVPGRHSEEGLLKTRMIKSEEGGELMLMDHGGKLMIDNAMIEKKDIHAANGQIQIINTVLMPLPKTEAKPVEKK